MTSRSEHGASTVPNFQAANIKNRLANRAIVKKAAHSNGTDGVSMKDIVRMSGLSKVTCQQHIYALEEVGQVERSAVTGHATRYGPRGTWEAHAHIREKTQEQVLKYGTKARESHLELEAWANHTPVHRRVSANEAQPLGKPGPCCVWELAA
jgi:hypothetical protein